MADTDIVDDHSMIFTEGDVYVITGYLAELWGHEGDAVADTEKAISAALSDNANRVDASANDNADRVDGLPPDLAVALRDPIIVLPRDHEVRLADGRTLHEHLEEWRNAPSDTASA